MGRKVFLVVALGFFMCCLGACGSSSGDSDEESSPTTIFPADLVVASPFATAAAGGGQVVKEQFESDATYKEKKEALATVLAGATLSACVFDVNLFGNFVNANCYGPQLNYTNHPDGAPAAGTLPGGDVGIWNETESSNACSAAQIDRLVEGVAFKADTAISILAGMVCVITANGLTIPGAGAAALDITTEMNSAISANGITNVTLSLATFEHQANDSAGHNVWFYTVAGTLTDPATSATSEFTVYLKHIPHDATNTTYHGKVSFAFSSSDTSFAGNCDDPAFGLNITNTVDAGSILYNKDSATELTYRLQKANFCQPDTSTTTYMFDTTTYDIDPADKASATNQDGWAGNFNYALFEFDPANGVGTYAYAWQAGMDDGNTRVFDAALEEDSSGVRSGCAYFGYGPDAGAAGATLGSIDGFICNWAGPGAVHDLGGHRVVQRQCMDYNAATGLYDSVAEGDSDTARALRIKYAPENGCDYSGGAFTYVNPGGTAYTNDVPVAIAPFSSDLIPVADMVFTRPTVPTEVYPTP